MGARRLRDIAKTVDIYQVRAVGLRTDRLGHYEAAATTSGFANTYVAASVPELNDAKAHLRDVLGDERYESFARQGEHMKTAEMVAYAFEQIDIARAAL